MNREEYEEYKRKKVELTMTMLLGQKCENCMFFNNKKEKCYKFKVQNKEINQCEDWEFEGVKS